jgi:hypothetical protein
MIRYGMNHLRLQRAPEIKASAPRPPEFLNGEVLERIFRALSHAAERGLPCPTNPMLGEQTASCESKAAYSVAQLVNAGRISVERVGNNRRMVSICGTPHRTQPTATKGTKRLSPTKIGMERRAKSV